MHCYDGTWPRLDSLLQEIALLTLKIQTLVLRCLPGANSANWSAIDQICDAEFHSLRAIHIECHTIPRLFSAPNSLFGTWTTPDIESDIERMESEMPLLSNRGLLKIHRFDSGLDPYTHENRYPPSLYQE